MNKEERPDIQAESRHLIRAAAKGSLATVMRESDGAPYASLAATATDPAGAPLLLLSDLADHTKNLKADNRVSLLLNSDEQHEDPMAGARLTLQGRLIPTDGDAAHRRYLARHAGASLYIDFADFNLYRLVVDKAHLVAGFGRIHWIDGATLSIEPPSALTDAEADIVAHMNEDHSDAVHLYATRLLGRGGDQWRMTGVDAEGADLRCENEIARLTFERPVSNSTDVRKEMVRLVNKARST